MTEQSQRPDELQRVDAAIRTAGVGVWLNPMPLGDLVWNDNTKAHFHLPPESHPTIELFYERLHPDDRERVRQSVERVIADNRPFDEVYRTVAPASGEQKWIHAVGRIVRGDDGQPKLFDGITLDITAPVSAQQRLREFADTAPAILWVTESNGVCTFLSRGWTSFTGQEETAGLGFGWLDMVHPEDRADAEATFRNATATHSDFALEHRIRRADGSWAWVIDADRARFGPAGEFLGYSGSVTDINDRRVAEDAVRRSSERYSRLLESIDEGFCVVQVILDGAGRPADYRFIEMNQVFERQTGLANPLGRTARELVPQLEQFWVDTYGDVALSRKARRFTYGSEAMGRWFDVFASPMDEAAGLQVAILFQDVSNRVEGERRLRESDERYRAFLANSTEGIWRMEFLPPVDTTLPVEDQVDAIFERGRFAECNDAFAAMYGLASAQDVVGRGLDFMMPPSNEAARAYVRRLIAAGYRGEEVESQEQRNDGHAAWFSNNLSGVVENGLLVRAWGTQRDITGRKRAEAALVDADQRKDEFLATLAHELRNPLAPIRSAAELLRLQGAGEPGLKRHAEMIDRQVSHLARMIDDLMDASRISRGKLELRKSPLVLQDVIRAALENAQSVLEAGNHAVKLHMPTEPVRIPGDEVRLVQVFLNLLTNAARYSTAGRRVTVVMTSDAGEATVSVRDEGVGIAADQVERVFEMFYQGGVESERASGGLGIGLSLVQRLAELHGGTVVAHSEGLGRGSEFVVTLPVPESTGTEQSVGEDGAPPRTGSRRLLVVDDNRDAADTLAEVLRLMGYEVAVAYDGVEGVARAQAVRPDVVILDLGMPRMDGYGACRALRETTWGRSIRILALSGWGIADMERAAAAGFDGHLVKPVAPDVLLRTIEHVPASLG